MRPGRRDALNPLFEREFVESPETAGIRPLAPAGRLADCGVTAG